MPPAYIARNSSTWTRCSARRGRTRGEPGQTLAKARMWPERLSGIVNPVMSQPAKDSYSFGATFL